MRDFSIGRIDGGKLVVCELYEFLRHAAGDKTVRMVFAHKQPIGALDLVSRRIMGHPHDNIRVFAVREMRGTNPAELVRREAEDVRDALKERELAGMKNPVGFGYLKQSVEDVFMNRRVSAIDIGDLSRVG